MRQKKLKGRDLEETKALRKARVEEKRTVKDLNQVGKRLAWCREKLEITQREVCQATGIPYSTYCDREGGIRTEIIEEYLVLAVFFTREWEKKFQGNPPSYNGREIKKISAEWLMFGSDQLSRDAEDLIDQYKIKIQEMERDHWAREAELKNQLSMFAQNEFGDSNIN